MKSLKNNLYLITLISGTLMAASSSSWFSCWLGLEINLMSLIPILITKPNPSSTESSIKYFIIQALASVIIIASASSMFFSNFSNFLSIQPLLLVSGIGMKLGAAPLHFWLPQVIQTADWPQILILLTWQKLAPMTLIMFSSNELIFILILSSCLVGVLGAINQTSFKKILVYSSILHSAWMLTATLCSEMIWWFYFSIYAIISASVIFPTMNLPFHSVKQIFSPLIPNNLAVIIFLNFFSLAGIPPFLGFFMKLTSVIAMTLLAINLLIVMVLITTSLMALYFYIRLIFVSTFINSLKIKAFPKHLNTSLHLSFFMAASILGNLAAPLMVYFY